MVDRPSGVGDIRIVMGVNRLIRDDERLLFAVGVFDGLHRGHRHLLARLRSAARRLSAKPAVITFDAHPDAVILGHAPALLIDPSERLGRLARAGVAVTVVQHFDEALRRTPYDQFVHAIAERTHLAGFVMTPDAAFGHERRGTPTTLAALGERMGYDVVVVPPLTIDGEPVRSARIRASIAAGDLAGARRLLGRSVAVTGSVDVAGPGAATRDGLVPLAVPMPVALPPVGAYRATVEGPWTTTGPALPDRGRPAIVVVADGRLHVPERSLAGRPDVRVALHAPDGRR